MLPGIAGIAGAKASHNLLTVVYTGTASNTANAASYTFSSASIGAAANDRYIVVAVTDSGVTFVNAPTVSSVTVAGQACTKVAEAWPGLTIVQRVTLWITNSPVTTGTTASIVVTLNSSAGGAAIGAWAVYGLTSTTPHDTLSVTGAAPLSGSIDHPEGGILIAAAGFYELTSGSVTWTNATEDFEGSSGTSYEFTVASKADLTQASAQSLSVTHSNAGAEAYHAMVAATWGPA